MSGQCICRRGYDRDVAGQCGDVNECLSGQNVCGINAFCKNLPGSYDCICPQGFSGNPFVSCQQCAAGAACSCLPPYQLGTDGQCQLSGCQSSSECQAPAQCVKIAGGVSYCACPTGYQPDPTGTGRCVDVDECRVSFPKACGEGAVCTNTQGSYTCQCPDGLSGDPSVGVCLPIRAACVTSAQCQVSTVNLNLIN